MTFLYPAFLLGALAIAIPVLLHLLRRDVAPDLPFTAVRLLKRSPVERSRRRRLRDLLLLAARVAALALLAAAFARPFTHDSGAAALPLRVIALDQSFSMAAPGQFDRARAVAAAAIDEAAFGERVAVVGFDDRADVLVPAGSKGDARAAVAAARPGHGGTRFNVALSKAAELGAGAPVRVIVVTDAQRAGWEGESRLRLPQSVTVEVRRIDPPPANVAVVGARVVDGRLVATVRNAGAGATTGALRLQHEGRDVERASYAIPPASSADVPFAWRIAPGAVSVRAEDPSGFPSDNARHLLVGGDAVPAVLVVTSPDAAGFYLQRALDAAEGDALSPYRTRLVSAGEIAGGRAQQVARHRAVVLLSTRGLDRAAREAIAAFVREGGGLMVAAAPDVEPDVVASMFGWKPSAFGLPGEARTATLTATDIRHPILQPFGALAANLGHIRFTQAWRVSPEGWHVAARFDDGSPALLDRREGKGRIVLFASDLDRRWNDFPLHPVFVPFVVESVRHVASRAVEPDDYAVGLVPAGMPAEPGVHRLESGRIVAVNVDTRESGLGAMTAEEFAAMIEPVQASAAHAALQAEQVESRQSLWQYGLLLMLGVLVVESLVGRV